MEINEMLTLNMDFVSVSHPIIFRGRIWALRSCFGGYYRYWMRVHVLIIFFKTSVFMHSFPFSIMFAFVLYYIFVILSKNINNSTLLKIHLLGGGGRLDQARLQNHITQSFWNYYLDLYRVVSYLCVIRGCLSNNEKHKFYLNSEYIIIYSMQRALPLNLLKTVTHSSRSYKVPFLTN